MYRLRRVALMITSGSSSWLVTEAGLDTALNFFPCTTGVRILRIGGEAHIE